jgi:hypothetical protein
MDTIVTPLSGNHDIDIGVLKSANVLKWNLENPRENMSFFD